MTGPAKMPVGVTTLRPARGSSSSSRIAARSASRKVSDSSASSAMATDHTLSRGIVAKSRSARRSYSRRASAGRPVCR